MASGKTLYIKGDRDVEVTKPDVTLADLLSMECSDQSLLPKLKTMKILKFKKTGNQRCVISVLKIIRMYPRPISGYGSARIWEKQI